MAEHYFDVTVRIPMEKVPPDFDAERLRDDIRSHIQGVIVPLHEYATDEPQQWSDFHMHWHSSTSRDACYGCIEIAQDGVN